MKKGNLLTFLLLAGVLIIAAFPLAGCGSNGSTTTAGAETAAAETIAAETTTANLNEVICKNNKFTPDALTIKVGTTVTWVNQDGYVHTVTSGTSPSDRSGVFDSGNLAAGGEFSFTFDTAGTFDYFCIPHFSLGMIGKIIVE